MNYIHIYIYIKFIKIYKELNNNLLFYYYLLLFYMLFITILM